MFSKICHYLGIISCIGIIAACFLPWTHYNAVNETFTGFHVTVFPSGKTYGRAGIGITGFAIVILILMLIPKVLYKRINVFIAAFLFAYCIRTYILFTGETFQGEVDVKPGIYLVLIFSVIILIASIFPKLNEGQLSADNN